jgi:tetratricopeptide (TPR) repeat protein
VASIERKRLLAGLALFCLCACAVNKFASIPLGTDIEDARRRVGHEKSYILAPKYMLLIYEPADDRTNYTVLKFVDGKLEMRGLIPKWVINQGRGEPGAKRQEGPQRSYCIPALRLRKQGLHEEAYNLMKRYIADHPDTIDAYSCLAVIYREDSLGDSSKALYEKAIAGQRDPKKIMRLRMNYMPALMDAGQPDKAESLARELLADSATDPKFGVHYNLACLYSKQNRKDEALLHLREILGHGDKGFTRKYLDEDHDLDNIRREAGFLEIRRQLPETGKKGD